MHKPVKNNSYASGDSWILTTVIILSAFGLLIFGTLFASFGAFSIVGMTYTGEQSQRQEKGDISDLVESIEIINQYGNVEISNQTQTGWNWDVTAWADTQEKADELRDLVQMDVVENNGKQTWSLILPDDMSQCNGIKSNLALNVPKSVKVIVNNQHGDTKVSGVAGGVDLNCEHGEIACRACPCSIVIDSRHGDIQLTDFDGVQLVTRHGDLTVKNSSGAIIIESAHGDISARDVNGKLDIHGAHGDIDASNVQGNVSIKNRHGEIELACSSESIECSNEHNTTTVRVNNSAVRHVDIRGQHSDIYLSLPDSLKPKISANVRHGDIQSEFQSDDESEITVKVSTTHDDIRIRKHALPETKSVNAEAEVESQ